ncbi:Uncharacterised protein [Porphyromonas macacae]|uniref:EcxA zinc-binding domain-containing protein n=2 Tax=Porphyromonas macacae TaxID=28115 RepID=A0A379EBI9_9PORP|nr:Uncharacterised protein [Porphyromonas macacae]
MHLIPEYTQANNVEINRNPMAILKRILFPQQAEAETEIRIPMYFASPVGDSDRTLLRCHLHDETFHIDHYLPDIPVGSLEAPRKEELHPRWTLKDDDDDYLPHIRIAKLTFPEELAGGTFRIDFLIQCLPDDLAPNRTAYAVAREEKMQHYHDAMREYLREKTKNDIDRILKRSAQSSTSDPQLPSMLYHDVDKNYFRGNIEVLSHVPQAPKIESVCWGIDEQIRFGQPSVQRSDTRVGKNETLFLHIQTRGLYGKVIPTSIGEIRIKDNTAVCAGQLWDWVSKSQTFFFDTSNNRIKGYAGLFLKKNDGSPDTTRFDPKSIVQATPQLIYDSNRVVPVRPSTTAVTVSVGSSFKPVLDSEACCMVEFRPGHSYRGDFGFSWFRKGDLQLRQKYSVFSKRLNITVKTINLPSIVQNGNKSSEHRLFKKDPQMYRNHSLDYYRILMSGMDGQIYHIPYMTLRKGVEAELSLHITVRERPEKLVYRFDNPTALNEGYMTINGSPAPYEDTAPPEKTGDTPDIARTVKIKCLKEFSKPLRFEVYAKVRGSEDEHLCGAVHIFPNDALHQRKIRVVFFNVITKIDGEDERWGIAKNDTSKSDTLTKYLGQAYIVPEITTEKLDLIDKTTGATDAGYLACCEDTNKDGIKDRVNSRKYDLKGFLVKKLQDLGLAEKYEKHFKIFFIGDKDTERDGFSKGEKFTVCFSSPDPSTPAHELGHALGLPHTFDGSTSRAKYVYEDGMTDNIMDYSHSVGVPQHSFFHWQWHVMNIKVR